MRRLQTTFIGWIMDKKNFTHVFANVVLVAMVLAIAAISFVGATTNVFKNNDNSPIYRGSGHNQVSLMVNVYWGTEYIDQMLDVFDKYNVKTTFFVGGSWAANYPELLQKIVLCGHELGNHGYFHKEHSKLNYDDNVKEIVSCAKMVYEYTGVVMSLFAPPGGDFDSETLAAARDNGYKTIMWSRDTIDWRDKNSDTIFTRATKNISGGELILIHPTAHTAKVLERIVKYILDNNLTIVPVSTNIGEIWTSTNSTQAD